MEISLYFINLFNDFIQYISQYISLSWARETVPVIRLKLTEWILILLLIICSSIISVKLAAFLQLSLISELKTFAIATGAS